MNPAKYRLTAGMLLRMAADTVMIHVALLAALLCRFCVQIIVYRDDLEITPVELFSNLITTFSKAGWPLTLICLTLFFLSGFYTYGRAYQSRYKALVVTQMVTLSYLVFGAGLFFFKLETLVPRSAMALAWLFTVVLIVGSRLWASLWVQIVHPERESLSRPGRPGERTILVIGGAGYIGSALLSKLLDRGYRVRLLDLMIFGDEPIRSVINHPRLEIRQGDFRHVEQVAEALRGVDSVVHLGAIVGDPACNLDEELTIEVNLTATRMIAELAKANGVRRFVFASTCSVYGACDEVLDERSIVKPISLYGHTKLASERVLQDLESESFSPSIVRFATIYGLSGRTRFDLVVNLLTAKAKMEGKITVFGGDQWRPFVHVDDAAAAVAAILDAPLANVAGEIFNVGSSEQNYTITQVGELVHEAVVGAELLINTDDTDRRNYRVDFSKIRNLLAFRPKWTVEQGIQQVLDAIANGEVDDYADARYSNVKFLSEKRTDQLSRNNWAHELVRVIASQ